MLYIDKEKSLTIKFHSYTAAKLNIKNYRDTAYKREKINTPSSSQVVQPLYKSSIDKWKNYEKELSPIRPIVQKWITYFNY